MLMEHNLMSSFLVFHKDRTHTLEPARLDPACVSPAGDPRAEGRQPERQAHSRPLWPGPNLTVAVTPHLSLPPFSQKAIPVAKK